MGMLKCRSKKCALSRSNVFFLRLFLVDIYWVKKPKQSISKIKILMVIDVIDAAPGLGGHGRGRGRSLGHGRGRGAT